jgi:hypothetical protein
LVQVKVIGVRGPAPAFGTEASAPCDEAALLERLQVTLHRANRHARLRGEEPLSGDAQSCAAVVVIGKGEED